MFIKFFLRTLLGYLRAFQDQLCVIVNHITIFVIIILLYYKKLGGNKFEEQMFNN